MHVFLMRAGALRQTIKLLWPKQEIDSEAVWQQDKYQVMRRSSRVVTGKLKMDLFAFTHFKYCNQCLRSWIIMHYEKVNYTPVTIDL